MHWAYNLKSLNLNSCNVEIRVLGGLRAYTVLRASPLQDQQVPPQCQSYVSHGSPPLLDLPLSNPKWRRKKIASRDGHPTRTAAYVRRAML